LDNFKLPLILSPSIGCPQIIDLNEDDVSISAIIASTEAMFGNWSLSLSSSYQLDGNNQIPLIEKHVVELSPDSSYLPSSIEGARDNISKEVFQNVLGGNVKIFKVTLSLAKSGAYTLMGTCYSCLCDLKCSLSQKKPHAVFLTKKNNNGLRFIHLTDLHIARRNDLIKNEIATVSGPITGFNNFNDNLRKFIKEANRLADKGELDLVLIGGDLIDFVNHGVSDSGSEPSNNWQVFLEIFTGFGHEHQKGNHGIKVPVFTATGNHDWRLHPYSIGLLHHEFRLDKKEAKKFNFNYYDSKETLSAKNNKIYSNIIKEGSIISKESLHHSLLKSFIKYSEKWQAKALVPFLSTTLVPFLSTTLVPFLSRIFSGKIIELLMYLIVIIAAHLIHSKINYLISKYLRYAITHAIIPIEAGVQSLHQYFMHISPYFNFAFSYGSNHFIMMDTGPDCFTGQKVWDDGNKKRGRLSLSDNIMGGSPDSMAFYPVNEYYSYNQISWLERILLLVSKQKSDKGSKKRIFICLHAPPINVKKNPDVSSKEKLLKKCKFCRIVPKVICELFCDNIRFGTINHFLSQFFHLCVGKKEKDTSYAGEKVDIVFSGHAHHRIEFRIDKETRVYCGNYSDKPHNLDDKRPFVVQTAACGPIKKNKNGEYQSPPYFRTVHVDNDGTIVKFSEDHLE
jgi:predicted MPP superfamily phosphohydrolase